MIKNIDIFGTCFTRELFNYTNDYVVNTYIMQQQIYNMNTNPYCIELDKITTKDDYKFKNKMLYYDLNKIGFRQLKKNPQEYCIIDFGDQARNILIVDDLDNVNLTSTNDMKNNLDRLGLKYHEKSPLDFSTGELYFYLAEFLKFILSIYSKEKIILNRFQVQGNYYVDGTLQHIGKNEFAYQRRDFYKLLENIFLKMFPDCKSLTTLHKPILDINHYLGGPFSVHFESIYDDYRMKLLAALINDKPIVDIEKEYENIYNKNIELIKKKKLLIK